MRLYSHVQTLLPRKIMKIENIRYLFLILRISWAVPFLLSLKNTPFFLVFGQAQQQIAYALLIIEVDCQLVLIKFLKLWRICNICVQLLLNELHIYIYILLPQSISFYMR